MDVFVYGTLTDPDRAGEILGRYEYFGRAVLDGCHRVEGSYPTLAPGGRLLGTPDVTRLDRYEGVGRGLYVRVSIPVVPSGGRRPGTDSDSDPDRGPDRGSEPDDAGPGTVETYVGDPDRLDAPVEWPGEGPFPERVREYVRSRGVSVRVEDCATEPE